MSYSEQTLQYTSLILEENNALLNKIDNQQIDTAIAAIQQAERIFFLGLGRSGLALKMAAMRFMHLGLHVFVAGEIVTPAIRKNDLLIVASGSGTTATVINAVDKAQSAGAKILGLTASSNTPLTTKATHLITIPAAAKTDFSTIVSPQYAGSLFEQFSFLLLDGIFMTLWQISGKTKEELWPQHANLE